MRTTILTGACVAAVLHAGAAATPADAQQDTTRRPAVRSDSALRADSIAREDSVRLVRELERIANEPRRLPEQPRPQPAGARLLPDISAIGDVIADLSPDGSTLEGDRRIAVREVELAIQANVDPYFRGDFILGLHEGEGIEIEEAYLTAVALPWHLQARVGRFLMPVGKQNTTHRAELHTIEYPYVIQRFLGPEGGKGTGVWLSRIFAPFGFYQELQLSAVDRLFGDAEHAHEDEAEAVEPPVVSDEQANNRLSGLGFAARLRNYWDVSEAANVELSFSGATGRRAEPVFCEGIESGLIACGGPGAPTGVNARQSIVGADFTFRWRPLQQGLYKSFILQAELMRQVNREPELVAFAPPPGYERVYEGPVGDVDGAYLFSRYQLTRRVYLGGRFDWLRDRSQTGGSFTAVSGYLTFFPSEFSKLVAAFERAMPQGDANATNRLLFQATFALGPHRPHPF